jgi:hypothetical protein
MELTASETHPCEVQTTPDVGVTNRMGYYWMHGLLSAALGYMVGLGVGL